jgi:DNA invertase Pin-like site-specific DNA recombinase
MAQMASVFAKLERGIMRERTRSAMSAKRGRGKRISLHARFGWDLGRDGRLVENAGEQEIIARLCWRCGRRD